MRLLPLFLAILLVSSANPFLVSASDESPAPSQTQLPLTRPRQVRVLLIVRDDCPKCEAELERLRKPGGPFEALKAAGWKIDSTPEAHVQIVKHDAVPQFAKSLAATDYPAVAGIDGEEVTRYFKSGCTTPLDQWTFGWLLNGKNERPIAAVAEPVRVAATGSYRLRGNHWSIEGDFNPTQAAVVAHLRSPSHANGAATYGSIEGWSLEELRSLHDDLHERDGGLSSGVGVGSSSGSRAGSNSKPAYMIPKGQRY